MPRFLLHHIVFDHGLVGGLGPDQPRLQGNPLCRKDWLQQRDIARSEWAILPFQEVAACPWCIVCEHLRSGNCSEAPGQVGSRRLVATVSVRRQGRCPGFPHSISDSGPGHWEWDLDEAGGYCRSVLEPPLSPQPTVPFQPELPLQELSSRPLRSLQGGHLTGCDWFTLSASCKTAGVAALWHSLRLMQRGTFARSILAQEPAAAIFQCRRQPNPGKWTHGDCLCRPLFGHPAWPRGT